MKGEIIFVAGGPWQKPFLMYLKNKGHFVSVVNPTITETTLIADYHIKCDVNDIDKINNYIKKTKPIFITSDQSDISTFAVSQLSEKWGLPGNNTEVIQKFTNKYSIYNFAKSIKINVPETKIVQSHKDIEAFAHVHGLPVIIKPTDATMSRGFRKIESLNEIDQDLFNESVQFSKSKQVIVQKFISGDMVTLEGVCSESKHKTLATSKKDETKYFKPGINSNLRYPSKLSQELLNEICQANDTYVEKSGMKLGLTHSEYIINEKGYWLIEIGARGGGAGIADKIVPWVSGVNTYEIFYQSLIGETIDVKKLKPLERCALLQYYTKEEMKNCSEEKAKVISNINGVASFHYNFIGKQYIKDLNDNRHSMGIYLGQSDLDIDQITENVKSKI